MGEKYPTVKTRKDEPEYPIEIHVFGTRLVTSVEFAEELYSGLGQALQCVKCPLSRSDESCAVSSDGTCERDRGNKEKPKGLRPVLAEIYHVNDLGPSMWYEVVYYDDHIGHKWCCFAGSNTFKDGETVVDWKYADECFKGKGALASDQHSP